MAQPILTKPTTYDIQDSNIALLGSDLEKRVREHAGDTETAWSDTEAGSQAGLQIWRIENFAVVPWPKTYKKTPETESLSYDLHFWFGENTTQDEAGTAAYKTVELDDHLHGSPVQYREVQNFESPRFLSYFPHFVCLRGGVSTGFHHVSETPPPDVHKLYKISLSDLGGHGRSNLAVREVAPEAKGLVEGAVYVLDKGSKIWQFNTKSSAGKEKFKAAEFVQQHLLASADSGRGRQGHCEVTVYDEGESGSGIFLSEFGVDTILGPAPHHASMADPVLPKPALFRLSDSTGSVTFSPTHDSLSSSDAFLLDDSANPANPAIYIWLGQHASLNERRLAPQYAQTYIYTKKNSDAGGESVEVAISVVKMNEGGESNDFLRAVERGALV